MNTLKIYESIVHLINRDTVVVYDDVVHVETLSDGSHKISRVDDNYAVLPAGTIFEYSNKKPFRVEDVHTKINAAIGSNRGYGRVE